VLWGYFTNWWGLNKKKNGDPTKLPGEETDCVPGREYKNAAGDCVDLPTDDSDPFS